MNTERELIAEYLDRSNEYWTNLTEDQLEQVVHFCRGKLLLDLGAGFGTLAEFLLRFGATRVLCVDKENHHMKSTWGEMVWSHMNFAEFSTWPLDKTFEVGIISWPTNNDMAMCPLVEILRKCASVVYIGTNKGGTQCGTPYLWEYLTSRELIVDMPGNDSSLMIYSDKPRPCGQDRTEEEIEGMNMHL